MHLSVELASVSTKCWVFGAKARIRDCKRAGRLCGCTVDTLIFFEHLAFLAKLKTVRRPAAVGRICIDWSVNLALTNDGEAHTKVGCSHWTEYSVIFDNLRR